MPAAGRTVCIDWGCKNGVSDGCGGKKAHRANGTKHGYRGHLGRVLGDIGRILPIQTRYAVLRVRDHPIHKPAATTTPDPTQVIASGNCPNIMNPTPTDPSS